MLHRNESIRGFVPPCHTAARRHRSCERTQSSDASFRRSGVCKARTSVSQLNQKLAHRIICTSSCSSGQPMARPEVTFSQICSVCKEFEARRAVHLNTSSFEPRLLEAPRSRRAIRWSRSLAPRHCPQDRDPATLQRPIAPGGGTKLHCPVVCPLL